MKRLVSSVLFLCVLVCALFAPGLVFAGSGQKDAVPALHWRVLGNGLELGLAALPESRNNGTGAMFVVLRIDPKLHGFTLGMASKSGRALSLVEWSRQFNLRAGINASMYLPDMLTSTGYMRNGDSVNNSNMGGRLGAFFVAGPKKNGETRADIIEKDTQGWQKRLGAYDIVVQNYRLISAGELLWPPGASLRSIAVVSKDGHGGIFFILCQEPLLVEHFAKALKDLLPEAGPVMYVEGGSQAGLFVRLAGHGPALPGATAHAAGGDTVHVWKGRQSLLNTRGNPDAVLPNVIGVSP